MSYRLRRRSFLAALAGGALAGPPPLPVFADVTAASGVTFRCHSGKTQQKYLIEAMTGGVAMLDYDGDGRLDLFFVIGWALQVPMPAGRLPDKAGLKVFILLQRYQG